MKSNLIPFPSELFEKHREVVLGIDIMFVNKLPFLVTISENIGFTTVENIPDRTRTKVLGAIIRVKNVYERRGFNIRQANVDNEFVSLTSDSPISLNITSRSENVPIVERRIRVIK